MRLSLSLQYAGKQKFHKTDSLPNYYRSSTSRSSGSEEDLLVDHSRTSSSPVQLASVSRVGGWGDGDGGG